MATLSFLLFHYAVPYTVVLGILIIVLRAIEERYRKANEDKFVKK